jgi:hypothetical protein
MENMEIINYLTTQLNYLQRNKKTPTNLVLPKEAVNCFD